MVYIVKSLKKDSFEVRALQKMHALPSPRNITVPGRLLECTGTYVHLMPLLFDALMYSSRHVDFNLLLEHLYSIIDVRTAALQRHYNQAHAYLQFVQFMHEHNVAYLVGTLA